MKEKRLRGLWKSKEKRERERARVRTQELSKHQWKGGEF